MESNGRGNFIWETNEPVQVYMELYLYKILDLDERNQVLHSNLWLGYSQTFSKILDLLSSCLFAQIRYP